MPLVKDSSALVYPARLAKTKKSIKDLMKLMGTPERVQIMLPFARSDANMPFTMDFRVGWDGVAEREAERADRSGGQSGA